MPSPEPPAPSPNAQVVDTGVKVSVTERPRIRTVRVVSPSAAEKFVGTLTYVRVAGSTLTSGRGAASVALSRIICGVIVGSASSSSGASSGSMHIVCTPVDSHGPHDPPTRSRRSWWYQLIGARHGVGCSIQRYWTFGFVGVDSPAPPPVEPPGPLPG